MLTAKRARHWAVILREEASKHHEICSHAYADYCDQRAVAHEIAARVLDERTEDRIHDSVLLVINGDISEREAVSAILAYLKGEAS